LGSIVKEKNDNSGFKKKVCFFAQLYLAQLFLSNGQWDNTINAIVNTFSIYIHLSHNENYVVFVIRLLSKFLKISTIAKSSLISVIEIIENALSIQDEKDLAILFFLAKSAMELGKEGALIACRIYKSLLNTVIVSYIKWNRKMKELSLDTYSQNVL
jgi:hypothetical protein